MDQSRSATAAPAASAAAATPSGLPFPRSVAVQRPDRSRSPAVRQCAKAAGAALAAAGTATKAGFSAVRAQLICEDAADRADKMATEAMIARDMADAAAAACRQLIAGSTAAANAANRAAEECMRCGGIVRLDPEPELAAEVPGDMEPHDDDDREQSQAGDADTPDDAVDDPAMASLMTL